MTTAQPAPARTQRPQLGDVTAGIAVALVLVPASLAYAEIAGMPPVTGLFVATVATLAAAPFASSPYLQTGPTAITSLLVFGALAPLATPGSTEWVQLAAVLALVVGVVRVGIGSIRAGALAYLLSEPVLMGFTPAAAIVIISSQLPTALGVPRGDRGILPGAWHALVSTSDWHLASAGVAAAVAVTVIVARRIHPLVPGVLLSVVGALVFSELSDFDGTMVGSIPHDLPRLALDLPFGSVGSLVLPGVVIAIAGFAEAAAIARSYATQDRTVWDPDREFVSQGAANVAAGLFGGFPVGGSFGRSAVNRLSGARTRWSGAVTGLAVLAFLPFGSVLESLPSAALSGIVIAGVGTLIRFGPLVQLWRWSWRQSIVALATFAATLALAPRVQLALAAGVVVAIGLHLRRELTVHCPAEVNHGILHLWPQGVLYFGSANALETTLNTELRRAPNAHRLVVHLDHLGRVDVTGALALRALVEQAADAGLEADVTGFTPASEKIVKRVLGR